MSTPFYDLASLVVVPSGYKASKVYAQKPLTTDGQLTFSRSTGATRVGPNGLIEKVRTNVILQSNTFSTTWTNVNTTETIGQAGYDGTNNAWLLNITGGTDGQRIVQSVSLSGLQTFSIYAKAGTLGWMRLRLASATSPDVYFDLVNGALGGGTGSGRIEPAGNGFYRCSIFADNPTTEVRIHLATGSGNISQTSGNIIIQNAQLEAGDIATDYIATTSAAVSVGPVANVPRLDYSGGSSCPRLLLEPQTTALNQFSEQIDNAYWTKIRGTVVANTTETLDPSGYYGADKLIQQSGFTTAPNFNKTLLGGAGNHTASVFVKKGTFTFVALSFNGLTYFDLENGTIGNTAAAHTPKIEDYGNGWYRCSVTNNLATAVTFAPYPCSANGTLTTPDTEGYAYFWGANVTATAYPQSYIPTLGAAVTRGADACSKTGISSLIGQTDGTLFVEVSALSGANEDRQISINDGTTSNRVTMALLSNGTQIQFVVQSGGSIVMNTTQTISGLTTGVKIAYAYKVNDFAVYVNGSLLATDTNGAVPVSMSAFSFDAGNSGDKFFGKVSQALLFKTRLPNAQLAELTQL